MRMNKTVIKVVSFCLIFCVLFVNVQNIFQAKWGNDYDRVSNFYNQEELDVVFIGTSHIHFSINPLLLFKNFGFTAYDFSSDNQDLSLSLLYTKEVIKEYKPKVIVLDVLGVSKYILPESNHRKGLDPLPISYDMYEQINYVFQRNEYYNQEIKYDSLVSYFFPIMRYHNRWNNIKESDFTNERNINAYYGYEPHYNTVNADFQYYNSSISMPEEIWDEQQFLLDEIRIECKKNNVELLLIKTPSPMWRKQYHNMISEWAKNKAITFIDYTEFMDELDINSESDFCDKNSHLNDLGATKITTHIGTYLNENYILPDRRDDEQYNNWDKEWIRYQQEKAAYFLPQVSDWSEYIKSIQNDNYTVYLTVKDNAGGDRMPEFVQLLKNLGLRADLEGKKRWSYLAIIDKGSVIYEKLDNEALACNMDVNGHSIELISEGYKNGNRGSIKIDGKEYFVNKRGIGIVVYDNVLNQVVDSVTFDFYGGGNVYR